MTEEQYKKFEEEAYKNWKWNCEHPEESLKRSIREKAESNNQIRIMTPEEFEEEQKAKRAKRKHD